jgi:hypothetical protein
MTNNKVPYIKNLYIFTVIILAVFLLMPAAAFAEGDAEPNGDSVAAVDSSSVDSNTNADAPASSEPSGDITSDSSSDPTPDSPAPESSPSDPETTSTEPTGSETPPDDSSEDTSSGEDNSSADSTEDTVEDSEAPASEELPGEPADSETTSTEPTGSETPPDDPSEEPSDDPADSDNDESTEVEGNSYTATITPDAVVDGDAATYPDFAVTGQEDVEFTITFTEVGDKAIGSAQVEMPAGFREFAFDSSTIQTSSGQQWSGELVSACGYYLNLWALSVADYLGYGESVSATFTAKTPADRGVYEFETKAWIDAGVESTVDGKLIEKGTTQNNMAVGYSDPVVIVGNPVESAAELDAIDSDGSARSDHYVQVNIIDLGSYDNWQPIGSSCEPFEGSFNGNGFSIDNLTINQASTERGLFGVTEDATLINISLVNVNVNGKTYTGSLIGHMKNGMVHNSSASGTVLSSFDHIGGLIGWNYGGMISGSSADIEVSGRNLVGGLVGLNEEEGTIAGSSATGDVTGDRFVGGLVGINQNSSLITGSQAACVVTGREGVGGLLGENNSAIVTDCHSSSEVFGTAAIADPRGYGGLIGRNGSAGYVLNSYATGTVKGKDDIQIMYVGGLVGLNGNGDIVQCYATGDVSGHYQVGGLVGYNLSTSGYGGTTSGSHATGNVTAYGVGNVEAGGLVGLNDGRISDSYATGSATGDNRIGGLVGWNIKSIEYSYAIGHVTGANTIGGLVGDNDNGTIVGCFATGSVTGDNSNVGGLVGRNTRNISNCYATGNVTGLTVVGGLVGLNQSGTYSSGNINNCYAFGQVSGDQAGGLVGSNTETVTNSFYDLLTTGQNDSGKGDPLNTSPLQLLSTYQNAGWDIALLTSYDPDNPAAYTWYIDEGNDYPILWWQDMPEPEPEPVQAVDVVAVGDYYFDYPGLLFVSPSTAGRGGVIFGASSLITPWFAQIGSAKKLTATLEAYEQLRQDFEANKDNLSDREYARQQVELAVALAAIRALEATLASAVGQGYDLSAAISAYQTALNLVTANANQLTGYQQAYALLILNTIAEVINDLGGST